MGLTVLYFLTILGIIGVVVSENRNPVKACAIVKIEGGKRVYFDSASAE